MLLGKNLNHLIKEWIENLRILGSVVNTTVVMAGAHEIILSWDATKLQLHGEHINITKTWARSLLICMGFDKRKCSNAGKVPVEMFQELKDVFLVDIVAEVVMNDIPDELIFNWDQTGLSILPTGEWTMEKRGEKVIIKISYFDDKWQITGVCCNISW